MTIDRSSPLRRLDLNLLLTFDALMKTRSATLSARQLHKTQPGVSRDLAKLRHALGDTLLVPVKGGLVPTERALELHAAVHDALQRLEQAIEGPEEFHPRDAEGVVNIGVGAHFELLLAGPLMDILADQAPRLIPRFHSVHGDFDPGDLDMERQDMAIGLFEEVPPRFHSLPVFNDERVAVMGPGHPLAQRHQLTLNDLSSTRWFGVSHMHGRRTNFDRALKGHSQKMHFQAYLSGFGVSPYVLMDNHYATTMPSFAAALHSRHFDLVARRLPKPLRPLVFRMVWTRRQDSSAIHRWVRQAILAVINDYIAGGALTAPHMPEAVG